MKKYLFGAMMLALAACQQNEVVNEENGNIPVVVKTSIDGMLGSRVSTEAGGTGTFVEDDAIGLFMAETDNLVNYTLQGSTWMATPQLYWPNKNDEFKFEAFYPYVENATRTAVPMPVLTNQDGTLENIGQNDFLVASVSQNYGTDGIVSLSFVHQYTLLAFNLNIMTDGGEGITLNSFKLDGEKIVAASDYSFATSSVQYKEDGAGSSLTVTRNAAYNKENETLYILLNPVQLTEGLKVTCEYIAGEKQYAATATLPDPSLAASKLVQYKLSIKEKEVLVSGCTVTPWTSEELEEITIDAFERN